MAGQSNQSKALIRRDSLLKKAARRSSKDNLHLKVFNASAEQQVTAANQVEAGNDNLYERQRAELANMEDTRLFSSRQLDLLGIVHPRSRNTRMIEAMRQIRTRLYSLRPDGNFSVLVCAVVPDSGGSFVALNLAATISFDQAKTSLLIDANTVNPMSERLIKLVGRENCNGLLDYLEQPEIGVESIVQPSGISRMRLIPIGRNEGYVHEHFTSARYKRLMSDIQQRYINRYVIVDGPPLSTSTDARVLSEICDYTILVVPYGGVTPGALDSAVDEIDERKLAGVVINDQPE